MKKILKSLRNSLLSSTALVAISTCPALARPGVAWEFGYINNRVPVQACRNKAYEVLSGYGFYASNTATGVSPVSTNDDTVIVIHCFDIESNKEFTVFVASDENIGDLHRRIKNSLVYELNLLSNYY